MANDNIPVAVNGDWVKILTQVGFPIFVALWFMGVFDNFIPSSMSAHYRLVEAHVQEATIMKKSIDDYIKILRLICRNTARDDTQRLACDG